MLNFTVPKGHATGKGVLAPPRANRARMLHAGMLVQANKECSVPWRLCLASGVYVDEPWHSFFAPMLLLLVVVAVLALHGLLRRWPSRAAGHGGR